MANNTYVALETKTLGSAVSSITFDVSSYTAYTDLQIVFNGGAATGSPNVRLRFNGDTGSNYSVQFYEGRQGGTAASSRFSSQTSMLLDYYGGVSTTQSMLIVDIFSFRKTGYYRSVISRYGDVTNSTYSGAGYICGLWMNTADAITSITIAPDNGSTNWNAGSTFTLYGMAAKPTGVKATGGAIYSDDTYFYHVFGQAGTFTPTQSISADVLVVAGGGGGGYDNGGAGGAGGVAIQSGRSLSATGYSITVGAGGGPGNSGVTGYSGSPSTFDTITATGGGGGGTGNASPYAGLNGGSGGGGSYRGSAGTGTTGTSGGATLYGNSGGSSSGASPYPCGGGGGAGSAGTNGSTRDAGNGGSGLSNLLITTIGAATGTGERVNGTWYIAGGGGGSAANGASGGGVGGFGGGGIGQLGSQVSATSGKVNTGGGGGAGVSGAASGGSGVVVIRYARA